MSTALVKRPGASAAASAAVQLPTVAKHEARGGALAFSEYAGSHDRFYPSDRLVDKPELARAISELEGSARPAPPQAVVQWARRLVGAYPNARPEDPDSYAWAIGDALSDVPADALPEVVREVQRKFKFLPVPKEVRDVVAAVLRPRRWQLARAREMLVEHVRREQWARDEAERKAKVEAERQAERERIADEVEAGVASPLIFDPKASPWRLAAQELALRGASPAEIAALGDTDYSRVRDLADARKDRADTEWERRAQAEQQRWIDRGLDPNRMEAAHRKVRELTATLPDNYRRALLTEFATRVVGMDGAEAMMAATEAFPAELEAVAATGVTLTVTGLEALKAYANQLARAREKCGKTGP